MTADNPVFVDTNVLVYAAVEDSPFHHLAIRSMEPIFAASTPVWISRQVIREFIAIMTRPVPGVPDIPTLTTVKQALH